MRVVVAGGGTGGHIYPALAVAEVLRQKGADVLYVGTARGMEAELVPREGIPFFAVPVSGLRGKSPRQVAMGVGRAALGVVRSLGLLRRFRPHVVLGCGGYVTGPVVLAALLRRIPAVLQEQNVVPGATNRWLAPYCAAVCVPYAQCLGRFPSGARLVVTGNPVRRAVLERTREEGRLRLGLPPGGLSLLVLGGSRGARKIAEAFLQALVSGALGQLRATCPGLQFVLVSGREYYQEACALAGEPVPAGLHLHPYLYNMEDALAACDLVVARAGAMTVAEVTARGLPAVLIPSPNVVGNHQEFNARVLEKAGAAVIIREEELNAGTLAEKVTAILSDCDRLRTMAEKARALGRPDAAARVAEVVMRQGSQRE